MFFTSVILPYFQRGIVGLLTWSLILLIFEQIRPVERDHRLKERVFYFTLWLVYFVVTPIVTYLPFTIQGSFVKPLFQLNLNSISTGYYLLDFPLKFIIFPFIPFLVFDFFYYWFHRMQHRFYFLWRQHEMHHSITHMNAMNSVHHWTEELLRVFLLHLPCGLLLTVSYIEIGLLPVFLKGWDCFTHSNIRLDLGILTPIVSGPAFHRIHHSIQEEHYDKNFAAYFPIYDILFGTYVPPKQGMRPKTGVLGVAPVKSIPDYLLFPFVRRSSL